MIRSRMSVAATGIILAAMLMFPTSGLAARGLLDPSFGDDGIQYLPHSDLSYVFRSVSYDPDADRLLGLGAVGPNDELKPVVFSLVGGNLDPSFGDAGWAEVSVPNAREFSPSWMAEDSFGRVIVVGSVILDANPSQTRWIVARLLDDGSLDPSFGLGGVVIDDTAIGYSSQDAYSHVALLPDGDILLLGNPSSGSGSLVARRFNPTGAVDTEWGDSGRLTLPLPSGSTWINIGDTEFDASGRLLDRPPQVGPPL